MTHSYLKFDLSRVSPAGVTPKEVTQATLLLWVGPFETPGAINVYGEVVPLQLPPVMDADTNCTSTGNGDRRLP
jgi:hypothetical protein